MCIVLFCFLKRSETRNSISSQINCCEDLECGFDPYGGSLGFRESKINNNSEKRVNWRTNAHIWRSINREYRYFGPIAEKFFHSFGKIVDTFKEKSRNRVCVRNSSFIYPMTDEFVFCEKFNHVFDELKEIFETMESKSFFSCF
jgi:hypothetical protein